jgi:hypothetical protein
MPARATVTIEVKLEASSKDWLWGITGELTIFIPI